MEYKELQAQIKGDVLLNAPMKKYTTYKIGGPADCLVLPKDTEDVSAVVRFARKEGVPYMVMGNGSNLLVSDDGIEGIVLRIGDSMNEWHMEGNLLVAQTGCILSRMARETAKLGFKGIEWAAGIPAGLGGAAYMNAGAYGHFFYEALEAVEIVDEDGTVKVLLKEELDFSYRHTSLMDRKAIVTRVMVRLVEDDAEKLVNAVEATMKLRREKQPLEWPSAGSVFKNPEGSHAGYLVELCGLRGKSCGGAQVSEKHGNFIVNKGGATAKDVLCLIDEVRSVVEREKGYRLETEILTIGRGM